MEEMVQSGYRHCISEKMVQSGYRHCISQDADLNKNKYILCILLNEIKWTELTNTCTCTLDAKSTTPFLLERKTLMSTCQKYNCDNSSKYRSF